MLDHMRIDAGRAYLAWVYKGSIGHSSINRIKMGEEAFIHLHLWVVTYGRQGWHSVLQGISRRVHACLRLKRLY